MKIITANGKNKIKISKKEWQNIGKKAGWINNKEKMNENELTSISNEDLLLAIKSKSSPNLNAYIEEAKKRGLVF